VLLFTVYPAPKPAPLHHKPCTIRTSSPSPRFDRNHPNSSSPNSFTIFTSRIRPRNSSRIRTCVKRGRGEAHTKVLRTYFGEHIRPDRASRHLPACGGRDRALLSRSSTLCYTLLPRSFPVNSHTFNDFPTLLRNTGGWGARPNPNESLNPGGSPCEFSLRIPPPTPNHRNFSPMSARCKQPSSGPWPHFGY